MGMLGDWIDSLTDDDRDAILRHPDPTFNGMWWSPQRGCGCLVGTVVRHRGGDGTPASLGFHDMTHPWVLVGLRFPELACRFGAERVWRAVKKRAAKGNHIPLDAPTTPETVETVHAGVRSGS